MSRLSSSKDLMYVCLSFEKVPWTASCSEVVAWRMPALPTVTPVQVVLTGTSTIHCSLRAAYIASSMRQSALCCTFIHCKLSLSAVAPGAATGACRLCRRQLCSLRPSEHGGASEVRVLDAPTAAAGSSGTAVPKRTHPRTPAGGHRDRLSCLQAHRPPSPHKIMH